MPTPDQDNLSDEERFKAACEKRLDDVKKFCESDPEIMYNFRLAQ